MRAVPLAAVLAALLLAACGHAGEAMSVSATATARASSRAARMSAPAPAPPTASAQAQQPRTLAASTTPAVPAPAPAASALTGLRPPIHQWPIPFTRARKQQMAAYSLRHYGEDTYVLNHPQAIVEHYTETATAREAYNTFAPDVPDSEFGELPNTCAHFLVEPSGRIDQLVPLALRCRHTVGLNWTAIGIENVGFSDAQILGDRAQISASLRLTRWLRCTYGIALKNVIGHNESLSSPFHRERVPAFAHQTHADFNHADMHVYRTRLARLACPPGSFGASGQSSTGGT